MFVTLSAFSCLIYSVRPRCHPHTVLSLAHIPGAELLVTINKLLCFQVPYSLSTPFDYRLYCIIVSFFSRGQCILQGQDRFTHLGISGL